MVDKINPDYYKTGGIECIDAIESAVQGKDPFSAYCTGNIMKYIWRTESKNGIEDLRKAKWYLERMIKHKENEQGIG